MHIPDLKFSTLLHILVVQCAISGCVSTPRDTVDEAMTSLCRGDSDGFASHLSAESRLLYLGLVELAPDRFACSGDEASPRIGAAVEKREGLYLVPVADEGGEDSEIAVIREDGRWRIDLFFTEESAFYGLEPLP